jgi:hypothetical protein
MAEQRVPGVLAVQSGGRVGEIRRPVRGVAAECVGRGCATSPSVARVGDGGHPYHDRVAPTS